MKIKFGIVAAGMILLTACSVNDTADSVVTNDKGQPVYIDKPYVQDFSVKYYLPGDAKGQLNLTTVAFDRNGNIQIVADGKLLYPDHGHFMEPGQLEFEKKYKFMKGRSVSSAISYQNQFVYADNVAVFSTAWGGKPYYKHGLSQVTTFAGGANFDFLVTDGKQIVYLNKNGEKLWSGELAEVVSIKYSVEGNYFVIASTKNISVFNTGDKSLTQLYQGIDITSVTSFEKGAKIVVGTKKGYQVLTRAGAAEGEMRTKLPWPEITDVEEINGELWFGSAWGAFKLNKENKYDYYASERWLPDNRVKDIAQGPDNSVLVLTENGLGQLFFKAMTLEDKAMFLEDLTRKHFIRYGFNCTGGGITNGNLNELTLGESDNDGLWTSMYLGGQIFRYAATKDPEALENCKEGLLAIERLYTITGFPGLPARAFEVMGYESDGMGNAVSAATAHLFEGRGYDLKTSPWRNGTDEGWVWKSTTSSDEVVGHFFALALFADLVDVPEYQNKAKELVIGLAEHIYKNDLYLVDWDGKPTAWGRWNPEYTNGYPPNVGDRKLTSSNIVAFLQAGYHFTGDEKYIVKIKELFEKHGYLENIMRPMKEIGQVGDVSDGKIDSWAEMLSSGWNHSDDEMYFLGYWCLLPYAHSPEMKEKFIESIRDHWEIERPEKDPVWNFTYALTGAKDFDLEESIWWLQEHPLDPASWKIENSQRLDIEKIPANFRDQSITEVLSPAEAPLMKHNGNRFSLDRGGNGTHAETPGDVWLLPYWMGRYLGVISAPVTK